MLQYITIILLTINYLKMAKAKKSSTATKTKKEIQVKTVGRNVIMVIDGKKYSKAIKEKVDRDALVAEVKLYNRRNSIKREKEIIKVMLEGKTTSAERKAKAEKAVPKTTSKGKPKKAKEAASSITIAEAKKMLENDGYTVTKKRPTSHTGRRREY